MVGMSELTDAWLVHLRERERSPHTIATYARTLRSLEATCNPDTATREEVEAWWASRTDKATATRINELAAIRTFYSWAIDWDHRADDPARRIKPPRLPKGLPRPVSRADLNKLLATLDGDLRRAVCLGAWGGLRISEAARLDWDDVDLETQRMRVLGKGSKVRLVGISPVLLDSLLPNTGGNVVTAGGPPYSPDTLQRKINRAFKAAGVNATFHALRHRFGTMALAGSGNLLAVSRALGHASPAQTAVYAATSDADLDIIAEAVTR